MMLTLGISRPTPASPLVFPPKHRGPPQEQRNSDLHTQPISRLDIPRLGSSSCMGVHEGLCSACFRVASLVSPRSLAALRAKMLAYRAGG